MLSMRCSLINFSVGSRTWNLHLIVDNGECVCMDSATDTYAYENGQQMLIDSHDISFSIIHFCSFGTFSVLTNDNEKSTNNLSIQTKFGFFPMNADQFNRRTGANDMVIFFLTKTVAIQVKVFNVYVDGF